MEDDPGWGFSWKMLPRILVPGLLARGLRRDADGRVDLLLAMRQMFLAFVIMPVLFTVVLFFIPGADPGGQPVVMPVLVLGAGVASLIVPRVIVRPLDCSSEIGLVTSHRTRFFMRMAFADGAALFGFVGYFTYAWWLWPLGLAFAAIGFAYAPPTKRQLAADQDELDRRGCHLDLVHVLRHPPAPTGAA